MQREQSGTEFFGFRSFMGLFVIQSGKANGELCAKDVILRSDLNKKIPLLTGLFY